VNPLDDQPGIDPGPVPPLPPGFTGELVCAEVDSSGAPVGTNSLRGLGVVQSTGVAPSDISIYNAIGIRGIEVNSDLDLELDGVEYDAPPAGLQVNFAAEGSEDAIITDLGSGTGSAVNTTLTLVPCSRDFDNVVPSSVTVQFGIRNEFEQIFSASTTVDCWAALSLGATELNGQFDAGTLGTDFGTALLDPVALDSCVLGVATTRRVDTGNGANSTADMNLHFVGNGDADAAVIRIR
jgi:hypothetical protein